MLRMTKLADYGIMVLTYFARDPKRAMRNARDLAQEVRLPLPTTSKILKTLAHNGLLVAHRGVKGGFELGKRPEEITVADIISAFEGPFALTTCSAHASKCDLESRCPARTNWRKINQVVHEALQRITLAEMVRPMQFAPVVLGPGIAVGRNQG